MRKTKLIGILSILLLVCMMLVVQALNPIKILLLVLLTVMCIQKARVSSTTRLLCAMLCISTLWGNVIGVFKGTPYPFFNITVGVIWPVLSLIILTPQLNTPQTFDKLMKWVFYMHSFLVLYDLCYAAHIIWGTPIIDLYPDNENGFTFRESSFSRMSLINLNVLTFTSPLFFLIWLIKYDIGINRFVQTIIVILNFFLLVFCGRRSLMLLFVLAPVMVMFIPKMLPSEVSKTARKYTLLIAALAVGGILYFSLIMPEIFDAYVHNFTKAFDSSEESTKFNQAKMLWGHFLENPIAGAGTGAEFYESDRGIRQHQFELTYLLKLATSGLIGFIMYLIGTIGVLLVGFRLARKKKDILFLCILFGFFFILLMDATNPVLCSFDLMLPLFICYAKINALTLGHKPNKMMR